jgi:hypothetical protein
MHVSWDKSMMGAITGELGEIRWMDAWTPRPEGAPGGVLRETEG